MIKKLQDRGYFKFIVFAVVLLIPFIYSFFYLKSYWDPYGHLSNIKVGVVNLDKSENSKGSEFVKQLKDSNSFNFVEVNSSDDALKGLGNDDYYAVITIPSDFTDTLKSASTKNKRISTIVYSPNKRKNYLSSQIINSALKSVELKLEENVSKEVTKNLADNLRKVPENLRVISDGASKLNDGTSKLNDGLNTLYNGTKELNNKYVEFDKGVAKASNGANELKNGLNNLNSSMDTIVNGTDKYVSGSEQLANSTIQYVDGSNKVIDNIGKYVDGVNTINSNKNQLLHAIINMSSMNPSLVPLANQAQAILNAESAAKLTQNGNSLKSGANSLKSASNKLKSGANQLVAKDSNGITQGRKLTSGVKQVKTGVSKLDDGVNNLSNGLNTLNDNSKKVNSAIDKLSQGANQAQMASEKLVNGTNEFKNKINDGLKTANDSVEKLNGIEDFVANPVDFKEESYGTVNSYGIAFAPLFISIGLWVGALMCYVVLYYDQRHRFGIFDHDTKKNKILQNLAYLAIGAVEGIGTGLLLMWGLKLDVSNLGLYIGECILVGIVFMSVIQFLIRNFGDVGKFVALIILVLQLAASGGTFPVETINDGFKGFNSLLPMTYSIRAFRDVLIPTNNSLIVKNTLILVGIIVCINIINLIIEFIKIYINKKNSENSDIKE